MVPLLSLSGSSRLQLEVAKGIRTMPPIHISHLRRAAVAEISATGTSWPLDVITTTRRSGVETVTMTTEVETGIMKKGGTTVATTTTDGGDTELKKWTVFV